MKFNVFKGITVHSNESKPHGMAFFFFFFLDSPTFLGRLIHFTVYTFDKYLRLNRHPSAEDLSCRDEDTRQKGKLFN